MAEILSKGLGKNNWKDRVISLKDAAKTLHSLTIDMDMPLEARCELYIRIIRRPDIRAESSLKAMIESYEPAGSLGGLSLGQKLDSELEFGALGKLQILQATFEDDFADFVQPEMEAVKNDLFDCVALAGDRHEKALDGVEDFVTDWLDKIKPLVYVSKHALNRIPEAQEDLVKLEASRSDSSEKRGSWLESFKKLFVMIINNRYRIDQKLMNFLTKLGTLQILDYMVATNNKIDKFKNSLVRKESKLIADKKNTDQTKKLSKSRIYKDELLNMFILASNNLDWLPKRSVSFLNEQYRWRIIRNSLIQFNGLSIDDVNLSPARPIYRNTFQALISSCPFYSDFYAKSLNTLHFNDDSLDADNVKWLVERIYPYSFGCNALEADKTTNIKLRSWYMASISLKAHRWCLDRLNDPALNDDEKNYVLSIMKMIP